jgi:glycerophosphoryl diester phosphodiesterase
VLLIAHRMPAAKAECARFLDAGADMFEVDVQLGAQGIVVSHYLPVPHTGGLLHRDNWRLRWGRIDGRDPALAAHLETVPAHTRILLDPKEKETSRRDALVGEIIDTLSADRARFVVSTGSQTSLRRLREAGFETWHSVGDHAALRRVLASGRLPEQAVTVRHTLLDRGTVQRLHEVVDGVVAWTVNRLERAAALRRFGVDGVTTDRVSVLRGLSGG